MTDFWVIVSFTMSMYVLIGYLIAGLTYPGPKHPRFVIRMIIWLPALVFRGKFEEWFDGR